MRLTGDRPSRQPTNVDNDKYITYICYMPQLHTYIPEPLASKVRERARARGLSVSKYLAGLVAKELGGEWPEGFFEEVGGGWEGGPRERPSLGELEERDELR